MGRQHQGMDRPGVRQVQEGSGEQGKMEKNGCKIICGAPTTLAVKELMMMMMKERKKKSDLPTCLDKSSHKNSQPQLITALFSTVRVSGRDGM